MEAPEWETLKRASCLNQQRVPKPTRNIPPAGFDALYEQGQAAMPNAARLKPDSLHEARGASGKPLFALIENRNGDPKNNPPDISQQH